MRLAYLLSNIPAEGFVQDFHTTLKIVSEPFDFGLGFLEASMMHSCLYHLHLIQHLDENLAKRFLQLFYGAIVLRTVGDL